MMKTFYLDTISFRVIYAVLDVIPLLLVCRSFLSKTTKISIRREWVPKKIFKEHLQICTVVMLKNWNNSLLVSAGTFFSLFFPLFCCSFALQMSIWWLAAASSWEYKDAICFITFIKKDFHKIQNYIKISRLTHCP